MATEPEDPILDAEDEGGPVKGFLEHLEDLRWVLLKSASALFICLLLCLFAAPTLVDLLKRPLEQSAKLSSLYGEQATSIAVRFGTNDVGTFKPGKAYLVQFEALTNAVSCEKLTLDLYPVTVGTNHLLAFSLNADPTVYPKKAPVELLNLSPAAGFFVALQVAFYGGLLLSSPFIFFFIAQFVVPALKVNELRYVRKAFVFCVGLFLTGIALCYFAMLPIALRAAVWFSNQMGFGAFQWTADTYIAFVTKFMLAMGIGFELPVFLLFFVKIGLLSYKTLASNRKIVFVVILIVAAILTPPDVVTQIAMAVPLYGLFEITTFIAWRWERKELKEQEERDRQEEEERKARQRQKEQQQAEAAARAAASTAIQPVDDTLPPAVDAAETTPKAQSETQSQAEDKPSESAKEETAQATAQTGVDDSDKMTLEDTLPPKEEEEETMSERDKELLSMVGDKEFVPVGEPNPPYMPDIPEIVDEAENTDETEPAPIEKAEGELDAAYAPYAEALEQSTPSDPKKQTAVSNRSVETAPAESATDTVRPAKTEDPSGSEKQTAQVYHPSDEPLD